jgi:hypothetical protein
MAAHCYDENTVKLRSAVVIVAAAIAAAPVLLDACLFMCHAPQGAASSAARSCHHAAGGGAARFRPVPAPCGHDHSNHSGVVAPRESSSRAARHAPAQAAPALVDERDGRSIERRSVLMRTDGRSVHDSRAAFDLPLRI